MVQRLLLLTVALLAWRAATSVAHEIPANVVVRAFVKQEGDVVRVLVRVPLEAMRDVEFPLRIVGTANRIGVDATAAVVDKSHPPTALLDLARADGSLREAAKLWVADAIELYANGVRLGEPSIVSSRASLPSERTFGNYADALASLNAAPLSNAVDIPWTQVMLDVALEYRIGAALPTDVQLSMRPTLAHLGVKTTTVLHYLPMQGEERVLTYDGDPGVVPLDVSRGQAAMQFVQRGFTHILDGIDHLLFLLCLVIPFRTARPVIALVTAFTVAHSITLVASALGYAPDALWFPPLIELLIAASIVYMACENILGAKIERRWPIAFGFGLVHGFGFSFALRETLQFAGSHLAVSLAAFNVGVELGQLTVLAVMLPALQFIVSRVPERSVIILLSAVVGHQAWHWMTDRYDVVRKYHVTFPVLDAPLMVSLLRGAAGGLLLLAVGVAIAPYIRRWLAPRQSVGALLLFAAVSVGAPGLLTAQKSVRSTRNGVFTAAQAQAGREVFVGSCTGCHTSASHTGAAFLTKWAGRPLAELYGYVSTRMPKANPGSLSEDEYVSVVAYVLKINGLPVGKAELSADPDVLNTIRFDAMPTEVAKPSSTSSSSSRTSGSSSTGSASTIRALSFSSRHATESR